MYKRQILGVFWLEPDSSGSSKRMLSVIATSSLSTITSDISKDVYKRQSVDMSADAACSTADQPA